MCKQKFAKDKPAYAIAISPQHITEQKAGLAIQSIQNIIEQECVMEIDIDNMLAITHGKVLCDYVQVNADSHEKLCQQVEQQITLPNSEVAMSAIVQIVCPSSYLLVQVKSLVHRIAKTIHSKDIVFSLQTRDTEQYSVTINLFCDESILQ